MRENIKLRTLRVSVGTADGGGYFWSGFWRLKIAGGRDERVRDVGAEVDLLVGSKSFVAFELEVLAGEEELVGLGLTLNPVEGGVGDALFLSLKWTINSFYVFIFLT